MKPMMHVLNYGENLDKALPNKVFCGKPWSPLVFDVSYNINVKDFFERGRVFCKPCLKAYRKDLYAKLEKNNERISEVDTVIYGTPNPDYK